MLRDEMDFFREHRAIRDFSVTGTMIVCGALVAGHLLANGLPASAVSSIVASVRPHEPAIRQTMRSVLDDDIVTGSAKAPQSIILDPCTGEQKMPVR